VSFTLPVTGVVLTPVPTLPQAFVVLLVLGLIGAGWSRLKRHILAE
jgi:hypothetical protein